MVKIILDTNFLMLPTEFGIDIFAEIARITTKSYQLLIVDKTQDELYNLIDEGTQKQKRAAKFAALRIFSNKI